MWGPLHLVAVCFNFLHAGVASNPYRTQVQLSRGAGVTVISVHFFGWKEAKVQLLASQLMKVELKTPGVQQAFSHLQGLNTIVIGAVVIVKQVSLETSSH